MRPGSAVLCALLLASACQPTEYCADSCPLAGDGACDDGRPGAATGLCAYGTDCADCGAYAPAAESAPFVIMDTALPVSSRRSPGQSCSYPFPGCAEWQCHADGLTLYHGMERDPYMACVGASCGAVSWAECPRLDEDPSVRWECRTGEEGTGCYYAGSPSLVSGSSVTYCYQAGQCDNGMPIERCVRMPTFSQPSSDPESFFNPAICSTWIRIGDWQKDCGHCWNPCNLSIDEATAACLAEGGPDACGGCPDGTSCVDGICVGEGALRITLQWGSANDLDLYVTTPGGNTISYRNRSADGGMLDQDDTSGGPGSVENVFFDSPLNGTYTFWVDNYSGAAASFNVTVYKGGTQVDRRGGSVESGGESGRWTVEFP